MAAIPRSNLMKSRARVSAAAIVMLFAAFGKPPAGAAGQRNRASIVPTGQVRSFAPVTDAMLINPDPADWPSWRRTLDGWGYSPLKQINTQNVRQLQLAWSWGLNPGLSQPTPLVSNGMMFIPSPGGGAQALDAATGDLLWEYKAAAAGGGPPRTSPMRNLAVVTTSSPPDQWRMVRRALHYQ
jgi:glucose dehydrogenase